LRIILLLIITVGVMGCRDGGFFDYYGNSLTGASDASICAGTKVQKGQYAAYVIEADRRGLNCKD
jgi:hypothetical protein